MAGATIIEAASLTHRNGARSLALDDLSFAIGRGEIFCLLGGSGAGKTTAVNLFMSRWMPTAGRASVTGIDCSADPMGVRHQTVFVTPEMSFHHDLSARDNAVFFARMAGVRHRSLRDAVEDAMRSVGIADRHFDRPLAELGRADSTLLWLALATLREAPAVIMDDPTAGLDAEGTRMVTEALLELRQSDRAILVTTADVHFATQVSDRIAVLRSGRKTIEETPAGLLQQNINEFFMVYAGPPAGASAP